MAVPLRGQRVASNWEKVVKTKPEDQVHNDYWIFNQLSKGDGFLGLSGGDYIVQPIEYALNTTVQSYSDTDTFSTTRVDVFDRIEADWKEVIGTVVMSDLESDRNSGDGAVFDLLPAKLESLKKSIRRAMNAMFFADGTGNGSKDFNGLASLVSSTPTTGTVEGINRATFSFFRNQQASGAQTLSAFDNLRATLRTLYNSASNGMGDAHPTFIVTTQTVFEGYEGLLTPQERFTDASKSGVVDGGFQNEKVKFKGAMMSYDVACPSGLAYELNPDFLKLVYKTGSWMKPYDAVRPANQTVEIFAVRSMGNLITTMPRRLAVATSIS